MSEENTSTEINAAATTNKIVFFITSLLSIEDIFLTSLLQAQNSMFNGP